MDIQLYWEEFGAGAPLILLHGNGESGAYFLHQKEVLAQRFRVLAVDTRGHGQSPRGTAPFTLAQFADDLCGFMRERGLEKAHILGFSDGGNIALLFALKHPEMVDRLILNGADLRPSGVKAPVQTLIVLGYCVACVTSLFDKRAREKRDYLGLMVGQPNVRTDELAALTMPVLVVAGTNDLIRERHTRAIAAALPNATLVFLEGDHFIAAKNSAAFNETVLRFLS